MKPSKEELQKKVAELQKEIAKKKAVITELRKLNEERQKAIEALSNLFLIVKTSRL